MKVLKEIASENGISLQDEEESSITTEVRNNIISGKTSRLKNLKHEYMIVFIEKNYQKKKLDLCNDRAEEFQC